MKRLILPLLLILIGVGVALGAPAEGDPADRRAGVWLGLLSAFELGIWQRHDQFDPAVYGPIDDLERRDLPAHRQIANRIEIPGRKPHHLPPVTAFLVGRPEHTRGAPRPSGRGDVSANLL